MSTRRTIGDEPGDVVKTARTRRGKVVKVKPDGTKVIQDPTGRLLYRKNPKRELGRLEE